MEVFLAGGGGVFSDRVGVGIGAVSGNARAVWVDAIGRGNFEPDGLLDIEEESAADGDSHRDKE